MKKTVLLRHVTDALMTAVLLVLMAYVLTGQSLHEWLGIVAFGLFILHHVLNLNWFRALGRGRFPPARVLRTVLVLLLLVSMLAQIVSGLAMSRHVLPFLALPMETSLARLLHLCFGYWSFLLVGIHLGTHWSVFLGLGRKFRGGTPLPAAGRRSLRLAAAVSAGCGLFCFLQQSISDYLFLRTEFAFFDYEKPALLILLELAAIFSLWVLMGYLLQKLTQRKSSHHKKKGAAA